MERFKFRVWDKERKCFFNDDEVVIYPNGEESFFNADYDFTECVVEQCTGLKDKNGKLIYEGDIVQMSYPYYPQNKYLVKWGDCCWELWLKNGFVYIIYEKMSLSMEVIGNIHKNKDLLGEE